MMNRFTRLAAIALCMLGAAPIAEAQQPRRIPQLCFLTFDPGTAQSPSPRFVAFFEGLRDLGYVHGKTINIHYLGAEGRSERFAELAAECLRRKVDIIGVTTTPGAQAARNATRTIPIVMVGVGDPVGTGLVESLARPGGNVTGMSTMTSALAAKRLALLKEAVPAISRVLVLTYPVDPIAPLQVTALREAASALGVSLLVREIQTGDDLRPAFEAGVREGAEGVLTISASIFNVQRALLCELAARHRLPAVYPFSALPRECGGLMAYAIDESDLYRRAATYVDRILKGANPSDLAVQQPTQFNLVINNKTAKSLGLTIATPMLIRANEIIQ
jgi:putative ABC transport system substrate-binding protein